MSNSYIEMFEKTLDIILICILSFIIGLIVGYKNYQTTHPVEEIVKVDSIIRVNDSIKIKVEQLDSIKDAKIIEVQKLDKDSTVKLFYKLIK